MSLRATIFLSFSFRDFVPQRGRESSWRGKGPKLFRSPSAPALIANVLLFSCTIIKYYFRYIGHYVCTGMYVHPVLCLQFSMYRYLPPTLLWRKSRRRRGIAELMILLFGSRSSEKNKMKIASLVPLLLFGSRDDFGDPGPHRESPPVRSGKHSHYGYQCLIILRNVLGPRA